MPGTTGAGSLFRDFGNDGDPDLLIPNNGDTADLLLNEGANGENSLLLKPVENIEASQIVTVVEGEGVAARQSYRSRPDETPRPPERQRSRE